jgi:hypothetical protein
MRETRSKISALLLPSHATLSSSSSSARRSSHPGQDRDVPFTRTAGSGVRPTGAEAMPPVSENLQPIPMPLDFTLTGNEAPAVTTRMPSQVWYPPNPFAEGQCALPQTGGLPPDGVRPSLGNLGEFCQRPTFFRRGCWRRRFSWFGARPQPQRAGIGSGIGI